MSTTKILLVILGRERSAHDIVYATAMEKDMDIVLISEPNIRTSLNHNYILEKILNICIYVCMYTVKVNF